MSDFAPPSGPPPPKVPEGWKAVWNSQYSEYFYVNLYTKQSQWEKPTAPIYPSGDTAPAGPPPTYAPSSADKDRLGSNNPYASGGASPNVISEDERLARRLQEEEDARARSHGGQQPGMANDYYGQAGGTPQPGQYGYGQQSQYAQQQQGYGQQAQPQAKSKGLLGKLMSKASGASSRPQSYPPQQHYGGYQQQGMYGRRPGGGGMGGMGPMGAGALGLGGGLLAGSMLADAGDHGGDGGGDGGGDYGGGDGGGDYGGGDGGGDFGGGDMGGGGDF